MSFLLFLSLLAPLLLLYLSKTLFSSRSGRRLPPSPPSLPFIGHLHHLSARPHRSLLSLSLSHPSPLLLLRLPQPTLLISNSSTAQLVLKTHDLAFASRPASLSAGALMKESGRNVSFSPYGEFWRHSKKLSVVHLLSSKRVLSGPFRTAREEEVKALVESVEKTGEREVINLSESFYAYANGVVSRAAAGKESKPQRFRELMGDISQILAEGHLARTVAEVFPVMGKLWGKVAGFEKKMELMLKRWDEFLSEIVEEHKKKMEMEMEMEMDGGGEEQEEDFVDVMLRLRRDGTAGFDLTEADIKVIIRDMTAAATDTTFVTLEWIMSELIRNPKVMLKLQSKIRHITDGKPMVTEEDLNQMEYLRAVVKETLRIHPPAPLLLPHESISEASLLGYNIPPKTKVLINAWAIGRDPQTWESPEEFRPERFTGTEVDFRGNDFQLIPFGAGRRMCPGINFATVTIEIALTNILYHFDWRLPDGLTMEELDMDEAPGLTTPRKIPLSLVATKYR